MATSRSERRRKITAPATASGATGQGEDDRKFDKILKDPLDLRDRMYEPALREVPFVIDNRERVPKILDQGTEGACTGFALTDVVNYLLHNRSEPAPGESFVSTRMLYEMARRYDEWEGENYDGSSIRGAMKGWHRHGVCGESLWPTNESADAALLDARSRPLGAYYRVRHLHLNHMHAALDEVGILYASASVHSGWYEVAPATGRIPFRPDKTGGHAFAIVGYDELGFWIQNSWGEDWAAKGFCHISYDDWLANGWDCWVARLGVPTVSDPTFSAADRTRVGAFDYIPHEAVVLANIRPHFVNLGNNGKLSSTGRYSNDEGDVRRIFRDTLPNAVRPWQGTPKLLLYAHGGLNSERSSATRVATMREYFLDNRVYPLHFMWETGLAETLNGIVADAFRNKRFLGWKDALKDRFRDLLDEGIELGTRPVGRPVWKEMKENAQLASHVDGGAHLVVQEIKRYRENVGPLELHLVGHSAGSIFHAHLIALLIAEGVSIASLTLLAPACTTQLFRKKVLPHLAADRNDSKGDPGIGRIAIFNLDDETARADSVASIYAKSLLYLVSEAFEAQKTTPILGMEKFVETDDEITAELQGAQAGGGTTVIRAGRPQELARLGSASRSHGGFDNDPSTLNSILQIVRGAPLRPFPEQT